MKALSARIILIILALVTTILPEMSLAARDLPPSKGGRTYELGMPPVYKGRSGFEFGWYRPQTASELLGYFDLGVSRDLGSPVIGIAALRLEGYLGIAGQDFDGGGRALFEVPTFYFGVGVDYNGTGEVADAIYTLDLPIRRGGLLGRGSTLAIRWLPSRDQTFSVGVNVPLWGRNIGLTRPPTDSVRLDTVRPQRLNPTPSETEGELSRALEELSDCAGWIGRLVQPFAERSGADPHAAMAPVITELTGHIQTTDARFPGGHTLPEEIRVYHETLDRAFTIAAGQDAELGKRISLQARTNLLDEVLIPYDYLLGQRKTNDSLFGMIAIAQTEFASWVVKELDLPRQETKQVVYVFQTLCDIMEQQRQALRERWEDSRFVWLPFQYALTPDQHDTQEELDDIVGRATKRQFTGDNSVWYVINEEFQWEMARSVKEAEDYHVLWIHDYRGVNGEGEPDEVAYAHVLNYLEALTERARAYDSAGKMPAYFIFLDQHYFEINKSRLWLRLLLDPLNFELSLPGDHADWEQRIRETQDGLRQAVAESVLLQLAASQYGQDWLTNQIMVHVNITNPADTSFWSWHSAGIIPIPDNMMRDHRKIAFYDVTEADPYRGMAMFTGMGIGEHYVGPSWEDRALMIQGPGALAVKDAARGLLEAQGLESREIPYPLRKLDKPTDYADMVEAKHAALTPARLKSRGQILQLHNETGFHDKPINAAKAVLYSLMPAGSVLEVPDSLWQSYIYASLLSGSALRGCKVVVIAPTAESAPSAAAPTLARAHDLMGRIIVFSNGMKEQIAAQSGVLKVGLYAPKVGVGDLAGRLRQASEGIPDWYREVFPSNPAVQAVVKNAPAILDSLGFKVHYLTDTAAAVKPKIHLKANFLATKEAWEAVMTRPELADVVRAYIGYLAGQLSGRVDQDDKPNVREIPEQLIQSWLTLVDNLVQDLSPEELDEIAFFFTVGSVNMDYRSMVMDGEVMILQSGWQSLYGFLDFLLLPGLCEWVDTTEQLDALLPPPSGMTRRVAGLMKLSL